MILYDVSNPLQHVAVDLTACTLAVNQGGQDTGILRIYRGEGLPLHAITCKTMKLANDLLHCLVLAWAAGRPYYVVDEMHVKGPTTP